MAQGQGPRSRRGGAGRREIALTTASTLTAAARAVLGAADPAEKVALSHAAAAAWRLGRIGEIGDPGAPERPARPARPLLLPPRDMPRRRSGGSEAGRIALLHALAHIELNAIDLAWDLIARFASPGLPPAFYDDWIKVAAEEATHHALIAARLSELGVRYGDLPAHDGLWEAAQATAHELLARLAVVPLVLEARGLDVTPEMIERLARFGDDASAAVLRVVYEDEIGHVATGRSWFEWLCRERGLEPVGTYRALVRRHFRGQLKPPFNIVGREKAGFPVQYYASPAEAE